MYVLAPNQAVVTYPYSFSDLRAAHPQISFPLPISDEELARWNVFPVLPVAPGHDPVTQNAVESTPVFVNGSWQQSWQITAASAEEIQQRIRGNANYNDFWLALLQTSAFTSIRAQATQSLAMNTAATEFIALLGDAKMGRPLEPAIQQAITAVLTVGTFTEVDLLEFQAALVAGNLEQIYSLEVQ
jgi:hypothetical protein